MGPTMIYNGVEEGRDITAPLCGYLSGNCPVLNYKKNKRPCGLTALLSNNT